MGPPLRRLPGFLATLFIFLMLAACGGDDGGDPDAPSDRPTLPPETPVGESINNNADFDGDGYLVESELRQAVRATFGEYRWPDGYTTTADKILEETYRYATDAEREGSRSQVGMEHTLIGSWHICAWHMAWLDAWQVGDSELEAEALVVMTNVLPENPSFGESTRDALREIAENAALGDPSLVQRDVSVNCADLPFEQTAEQSSGAVLTQAHVRRLSVAASLY